MTAFNLNNPEHREIVLAALAGADALGVGRMRNVREQLTLNGIRIDGAELRRVVFELGDRGF